MARNVIVWLRMNACLMPFRQVPAPDFATRPPLGGWLSGALLLAAACIASASPLASEEQELANRLVGDSGQHRDSRRMALDPVLTSVARARAADMAKRRYFSHTDPDGNGPNFLARSAGYPLPSAWGNSRGGNFIESICAGHATAEEAWDSWMHSSSHRTHLLAQSSFYRDQTNFGIGHYSDPSSPYRSYWVIITAPPSRGEFVSTSRRSAKPARVAGLMPIFSDVDPDEGRPIGSEPDPRVSAPRPAAGEKLWNWEEPISAPRPPAPRLINAG